MTYDLVVCSYVFLISFYSNNIVLLSILYYLKKYYFLLSILRYLLELNNNWIIIEYDIATPTEGVDIITQSHITSCEFNKKSKQVELTLTGDKKVYKKFLFV